MTLAQSFLLSQVVLGGLVSWRLFVVKGPYRDCHAWYSRVFWTVLYFIPLNIVWISALVFICIDMPLPYHFLIVTTFLTLCLLDMVMPEVWVRATSSFHRGLWEATMLFVRVMTLVNACLFLHEARQRSYALDLKIIELDQKLAEKDQKLAEKDQTLAEQDRTLAEKGLKMTARDLKITQQLSEISQLKHKRAEWTARNEQKKKK